MIDNTMLAEALKLLVTIAAAWGSVKTSLNGARKDITEIKGDVKALSTAISGQHARLSVLEDRSDRSDPA